MSKCLAWISSESFCIIVPRASPKRRDPSLDHTPEEGRRVLPRYKEIYHGQRDHRVNEEAADNSQHVEPQHLRRLPEVLDAHDLANNQAHDTEGGVPEGAVRRP